MKIKRKTFVGGLLATLCACATVLTGLSFAGGNTVAAADAPEIKASASYLDLDGSGSILNGFEGAQKEYIYFGTQNNSPVKWRVLHTGIDNSTDGSVIADKNRYGSGMLLWANTNLFSEPYNSQTNHPDYAFWSTSKLHASLNGGDYYKDVGINTQAIPSEPIKIEDSDSWFYKLFTTAYERNAVALTDEYVTDNFSITGGSDLFYKDNIVSNMDGAAGKYYTGRINAAHPTSQYATITATNGVQEKISGDKLFILDYYDINNTNYGFGDDGQTYAKKLNSSWEPSSNWYPAYYDNNNTGSTRSYYLLETTPENYNPSTYVGPTYYLRQVARAQTTYSDICFVSNGAIGANLMTNSYGVRPAFNLDTTKIVYATSSNILNVTSTLTDVRGFSTVKPEYKIYVKDTSFSNTGFKPVITSANGKVKVTFKNNSGKAGNIVLLLQDRGATDGSVSYQAVATMAGGTADQVAEFTLPSNFSYKNYIPTVILTSANTTSSNAMVTESVYATYKQDGIIIPEDVSGMEYNSANSHWLDNLNLKAVGGKMPDAPVWIDKSMHLDPSIIRVKEIKYKSFEEDATEVDKTSDGTSKIINAGEYTIKLEIIDKTIYKWLDKTTDDKSFKITVDRAKPNVTAAFKNTLPTNLYVSYNDGKLPELKNSATNATAGKIDWQADQSPRTDDTTFYWEFTPDDTVNYLKITGMSDETKITVPYKTQAIDKLEIILHKDGEEEDAEDVKIYDAFTLTDGSYSLKNYITVNAVYQDGITKEALGSSGYVLSIVGGAPKLSAGNLTIRAKQASGTKYGDLAITVLASEVVDIDPTYDDNGTALTYPVTIDDIKDNLKVIAKWNYSDNDYLDVDIDDVTVTGNLVAGAVGDVELTVSYGGKTAKIYPQIDKGTLDMSGVSLTTSTTGVTGSNGAYTCTYDPAVTVVFATSGDVKNADGDTVTATSTVTYKKKNSSGAWIVATAADLQNAGEYQIIAKYVPDDTANYKIATGEDEITVTLTINKAKVTGIVFEDAVKPEITGTSYTLEATGYPEEWVTVTYSVTDEENNPLSGTSFSAAGKYKFTATFTIDAAHVNNYEAIAPITKTLTISDKPPVTGAENIVVEPTISATYTGKPVDYKAQNVPEGVEVSYKIEKKDDVAFSGTDIINVGEYTVTVSFETGAAYAPIADKTCVVTVGKAKVDMSGVKFADDTVTGNGQAHKFEATNLPEGVTVEYEYKGNKQADPFEFTEVGEYTVKAYFTYEDEDNYEEIKPVEATLTISDAVVESISANVEDGAKFDINGTLDDVKAKIKAEIHFNNGTKQSVGIEDLTIDCATLREGGLLEVGTQTITVVYNDGTQDYTTTVQIEVAKAKVALPVYNGSLRYTGFDVKPAASDFEGFDSALMALVDSKTVAGLNAGAYKAVFALKDAERYEWATARTYKKSVFAAVVYEEVVLEDYEAAVDWNLARAKITATKANGKLPVFASESYTGSFAEVVGLKYYTDETCAEEVAADELAYSTKYFVKAELLDTANFELDETAVAFSRNAFEYTTPEKQLTVWEKVVKFLTINWLWIVIAVVALILLITVIALIARAAKRKREREEQRRLEEKEEKKREQEEREERRREEREERMARLNQQQMMMPQMMPMGGQMPQMPMQQSVPMPQQAQAQPVAAVGSASELAEIKAEISALRAEQNLRDVSALKAEQQVTQTKIDLQFANLFSRLGVEQGVQGGLSVNWLEEMVDKAVQKALAKNDKAEAQVAKADGAAAQVPPDAVMTTVTTTKIDTTKKPVQSAAAPAPVRTVVRNIVAPMPVDDGRVFDVGGFYKPADPLTDNIDDVLGNEDKQD